MRFYDFAELERAPHEAEPGATIDAVLRMA